MLQLRSTVLFLDVAQQWQSGNKGGGGVGRENQDKIMKAFTMKNIRKAVKSMGFRLKDRKTSYLLSARLSFSVSVCWLPRLAVTVDRLRRAPVSVVWIGVS